MKRQARHRTPIGTEFQLYFVRPQTYLFWGTSGLPNQKISNR